MTGFVSSVVVVITFQIDKKKFLENIEKHKKFAYAWDVKITHVKFIMWGCEHAATVSRR